MQVPAVVTNVTVRGCIAGEVQPTATLCVMCSRTTYSFNTTASTCNAPCSTNAECYGSSTLVPASQFWHSAVDSEAVVSCPNPSACQGDRNEMLACQDPLNVTGSVDAQLQVITSKLRMLCWHVAGCQTFCLRACISSSTKLHSHALQWACCCSTRVHTVQAHKSLLVHGRLFVACIICRKADGQPCLVY
jgi:hypothetical protein